MRPRIPRAAALAVVLALGVVLAALGSCSAGDRSAGHRSEATDTTAARDAGGADRASRPRPTPQATPRVIFEPEGGEPAPVSVEIAKTPAAIQRGLMYREHLPPDHGMLFIFPDEDFRSFWMKNTLISLDLIFISAEREVVGIVERAEPQTTDPRRVNERSQYVVEVNGGWASAQGIEAGTAVRFVDVD